MFFEKIKKKRTRSRVFYCPLNIHFLPMPGVEHAPAEAVRKFLWRARSQQAVLAPSLVLERSPNKSSSIRTIKKKRTRSNFFYCLPFNLSPCLAMVCVGVSGKFKHGVYSPNSLGQHEGHIYCVQEVDHSDDGKSDAQANHEPSTRGGAQGGLQSL